jgi:flagellar assembly protein FliH
MSSRARRVDRAAAPERFLWGAQPGAADDPMVARPFVAEPPATLLSPDAAAFDRGNSPDGAAIERDAFAKGYAQGERAGTEAGTARADAMLRRLADTLDDLQRLRTELIRRTERDVVELALAIARKVLHREASLDRDLLVALARVALDRLADATAASIRLHPDDYATAMAGRTAATATPHGVQILADPSVRRGGCLVRSDVGSIDVGVATQLDELTGALLGDDGAPAPPIVGLNDDAAA